MEKAIKRAIEGGWKPEKHRQVWEYNPNNRTGVHSTVRASLTHNDILLDAAFWQALGKSLGWGNENGVDERTFWNGVIDFPEVSDGGIGYREIWRYQMHRFIDHLASGKPADTFFEELLSKS